MKRRIIFSDRSFIIGILWLSGLMTGIAFAHADNVNIALIQFDDLFMPASFLGVVISSLIPITLASVFWIIGWSIPIYLIIILNGFVCGFCALFLSYISGSSVCFTNLYFMFPQICCSTLLIILCSMLFSLKQRSYRLISIFILSALIICFLDYYVFLI